MSPQSSLSVVTSSTFSANNDIRNLHSLSKLLQPIAASPSKNKRLDAILPPPSAVEVNPLDMGYQPLRKRKVEDSTSTSRDSFPNCSVNFLSALFNDIAEAQAQTTCDNVPPEKQSLPIIQPNKKKQRLSVSSALSRCRKSFKNLRSGRSSGSAATVSTDATQITDRSSNLSTPSREDCDFGPESPIPSNDHVIVSDHYTDVASIIDQVLDVNLFLPNLPATVSEHTCSSRLIRKLTPNVVPAAQVVGRSPKTVRVKSNNEMPLKQIVKDSYGWFVETDQDDMLRKRAEAIAQAFDKARTSSEDPSFSVVTASDGLVDDDDLEWAKAADTVDDVLGDFF